MVGFASFWRKKFPRQEITHCMVCVCVLRKVGIGTIPELHLRKVGILTLSDKVRIPTLRSSIPELSVRKVGIGTK